MAGEVVIVDLVVGKVDGGFGSAFDSDGFDEKARGADIVLVVECETGFVLWVDDILRAGRARERRGEDNG